MGLLDDLEFLKKQRKPNLLADVQQLQRPSEPYLRQQYPEVYGGLGGLLGMAPDEMAGSILDPNTARVRAGAEYGFPVGTAAQMLPMAQPAQAAAKALGPTAVRIGEEYLQRQGLMPSVVPNFPTSIANRSEVKMGIKDVSKAKNSPLVKLYHSSPYKNIDIEGFNANRQIESGDKRGIFFSQKPQEDYGEYVYEVLVPQKAITFDTKDIPKYLLQDKDLRKGLDVFVKPEYADLIQVIRKEHGVDEFTKPEAVRQYMANPALGLLQSEEERKKLGGLLYR